MPPPQAVNYRLAPISTDWTTIATLESGASFHSARHVLLTYRITARIGPPDPHTEQIDLQVLRTEAEWARDILRTNVPKGVAVTPPVLGFPVVTTDKYMRPPLPQPDVLPSSPRPGTLAVLSVAPMAASQAGPAYYITLTIILMALIGTALATVLVCLAG